jgi:hypothetical protein
MNSLLEEQYKLFKDILMRELTEDEKYLVRNSFQNGYGAGKEKMREDIIEKIKRI